MKSIQTLIEAIECYKLGKWTTAVEKYLEFLEKNYKVNDYRNQQLTSNIGNESFPLDQNL